LPSQCPPSTPALALKFSITVSLNEAMLAR
jgi:hypothetical protein